MDDAEGRPHLLDFGLAKVTEPDDASPVSVVTMTGAFIGTLPWSSPEQADGRTEDLDVRSDVYSLAVMLYHAVTGSFPYRVTGRIREVAENIRSAAPAKPSSHRPGLDRDLETILLKALSKEPPRRYQSADAFARDLRHFLEGEPIDARRDSTTYLLRKALRRHRGAAVVAIAFVVVLGAAAVVSLVTSEQARRAASRFVAVHRFFVEGMLVPDPLLPPRPGLTVAESLDRAAERIETLRDDPELEAMVRQTLAVAYRNFGRYDRAEPHFRAAWEIRERVLGPDHESTLESKGDTGDMLRQLDRARDAETIWREVVEASTRLYGGDDRRTAASLNRLAWTRYDQGDYADAERLQREALAALERGGVRDALTARILADRGTVRLTRGDRAGAASTLREARELYETLHGAEHPVVASTMLNQASAAENPAEAERLTSEALRIWEEQLGPDHPLVARALNMLALLRRASDPKGASELFDRAITIQRKHPSETQELATALSNAAGLLRERGLGDAAEPLLVESLEIRRRVLDPKHPELASSHRELGMLAFDRGQLDAAVEHFTNAVEILEANPAMDPMNLARTKTALGQALRAKGDLRGATQEIEESLLVIRTLPGTPGLDDALIALGRLRLSTKDYEAAEAALRECLELRRRDLPDGHWAIGNTESVLAGCLIELDRFDESEALARSGYETIAKARGASDPKAREAADRLATLYERMDRPEEAQRWRERTR